MARSVWLASYPRSGNTLLRAVMARCLWLKTGALYSGDLIMAPGAQDAVMVRGKGAGALAGVKTHEPPLDGGPAIYVVRDGRAATVSYWHYVNAFAKRKLHYAVQPWKRPRNIPLSDVVRGNVPFGSWSDHVRAWDPQRRPDTLLLRYEDLARDPDAIAGVVADFLSVPVRAKFDLSFAQMHRSDHRFFRSGSNEANIAEMRESDLALFASLHGGTMRELGYADLHEPLTAVPCSLPDQDHAGSIGRCVAPVAR